MSLLRLPLRSYPHETSREDLYAAHRIVKWLASASWRLGSARWFAIWGTVAGLIAMACIRRRK